MNTTSHPWVLTGPWYRWSDPYDDRVGRTERPVFQKYDSAELITAFLKDPQRSLKWVSPDDELPSAAGAAPVRKLYLHTHHRFYLVVCELHCDVPGFPSTDRDEVCEAGFVVRRRVVRAPAGASAEVRRTARALAQSRAQLLQFEELPGTLRRGATLGLRATVEARFQAAQGRLEQLATDFGVRLSRQGWMPSETPGVGAWKEVDATPAVLEEQVFPLYPLIPDPALRQHSSGGRTLYFGLLPTASADVDEGGFPRFDDRTLYEVRCYVRRHCPRCPKKRERNDCRGELVWSLPTEPYQVAAPFDLLGTSHRPVNIVLPDLPALEAQSARLAPGSGAPVRMISPPKSGIEMQVNPEDSTDITPGAKGAAICSFSLPLITIVATFVFRLFLPVVTFLFGLWFLLKLKFCIPPAVSLGAGVAADLDVALGKIDFSADLDIDFAVDATLIAQLEALVDPLTGKPYGDLFDTSTVGGRRDLVQTVATQALDFSAGVPEHLELDPPPAGAIRRPLPSATAGLEYEERVEVRA